MKLFFSDEDYYYKAMAVLNSECSSNRSQVDAFLLLIQNIPFYDLENLCNEIAKNYHISPDEAYNYLQRSFSYIKGGLLDIVDELLDRGIPFGNHIIGNNINTSSWLSHSVYEARLCQKLANRLGLNPNIAYNFGLLHDYGRKFSHKFDHTVKGFEALIDIGLMESRACLTHSFLNDGRFNNNEIPDDVGSIDNIEHIENDYDDLAKLLRNVSYTDYDRILNIADLMASDKGILSPIDRIYDILSRRGELDKSPNRVYFLTSFYNTLLWYLEKIGEKTDYKYLDYKNLTLEEIYKYLEEISSVFYQAVMENKEWTK